MLAVVSVSDFFHKKKKIKDKKNIKMACYPPEEFLHEEVFLGGPIEIVEELVVISHRVAGVKQLLLQLAEQQLTLLPAQSQINHAMSVPWFCQNCTVILPQVLCKTLTIKTALSFFIRFSAKTLTNCKRF